MLFFLFCSFNISFSFLIVIGGAVSIQYSPACQRRGEREYIEKSEKLKQHECAARRVSETIPADFVFRPFFFLSSISALLS